MVWALQRHYTQELENMVVNEVKPNYVSSFNQRQIETSKMSTTFCLYSNTYELNT